MIIEVSKKVCRMTGVLLVILIAGALYWYWNMYDPVYEIPVDASSEVSMEAEIDTESSQKQDNSEIVMDKEEKTPVQLAVHVSGAVKNPDQVYYLEEGQRVEDAVKAAGGAAEEADLSKLNLARPLQDGEKIYVPKIGEEMQADVIDNSEVQDIVENQEKPLTNINLATTIELMELPGIGEAYAARIVEYREAHGGFQAIEEIKNVSGIGDSIFEKIKERITVSD